MRDKIKGIVQFITNPRFLLCFAIGWLFTNGWSYIMFGAGTVLKIEWMMIVSGTYLAFLWVPFSPEKIVTFAIAIALLKHWFPDDEKTLAVLRRLYEKAKSAVKAKKRDN